MTISCSQAATRLAANAAAVATAMASGTAAADVTAIAALMTVLSVRTTDVIPLIGLGAKPAIQALTPG
jgi:hypothetical protein